VSDQQAVIYLVAQSAQQRQRYRQLFAERGIELRECAALTQVSLEVMPSSAMCVLMDIDHPHADLPEDCGPLCKLSHVPVIVICDQAEVADAVEAMKCGLTDFICRPVSDADLLSRVELAFAEQRIAAQQYQRELAIRERYDRLTPRECEVMGLVVSGLPNKKIATQIGVSIKTVEVHRARVMQKMEAPSLPNLVEQALFARLVAQSLASKVP